MSTKSREVIFKRFNQVLATEASRKRAAQRRAAQIQPGPNPATADMDYEKDELEFILAMQEYQHRTGRKFPAYSEILRVLKALGYSRSAQTGSQPGASLKVQSGP